MPDNSYQTPTSDERKTYSQWVNSTKCKCPGGGTIQGTPPPNMANLGDIIVDLQRQLNVFASMYAVVAAIIQVIMCIIEVICALTNPFALIKAIIKLFGVCIPELLLVIPQLASLAYIMCMIKIIIAIITYIVTVLIPLIQDIQANIITLKQAIIDGDTDALAATAFKITSLIKELLNLLGVLAPLEAIIEIIKALLGMGIGFPCGDDDPCCDTQVCPDVLKKYYLDGYDGNIKSYYTGGSSYEVLFTSLSKQNDLITLSGFFPHDADLSKVTKISDAPYLLTIPKTSNEQYIVTDISTSGVLTVTQLKPTQYADGYLSSVYYSGGLTLPVDATGRYVRFSSGSANFKITDINGYVTVLDPTNLTNAGTWKITDFYDSKNIKLDGTEINAWVSNAVLNPTTKNLIWYKLNSAPSDVINGSFKIDFNHTILMKYNKIGAGCHPAVAATKAITKARNPAPVIPTLPDISAALICLNNCVKPLTNISDTDVISDPDGIVIKVTTASVCISNCLTTLNNDMKQLAKDTYPSFVDLENSLLTAKPTIQIVGNNVKVSVTPKDKYGGILGAGLPSGTIKVEIFTTFGTVGTITEEKDGDGEITGIYSANLSSKIKGHAKVSAKVAGSLLNEFDGTLLNTRYVDVTFIDARDRIGDNSTEPMGEGTND